MLYCASCHSPLLDGSKGHIVKGKRVCDNCYARLTESPEKVKEEAKRNDADRAELFSYLLSIFPIGAIPDSWYSSIDGMLKKKFTIKMIYNTLHYIRQETEKQLTEDNWVALVYVYYTEACRYVEELSRVLEHNRQVELKKEIEYYSSQDTTKRDVSAIKIEDL